MQVCVKMSNSQFCFLFDLNGVHLMCRMLFQFQTGLLPQCIFPYQDYHMQFERNAFFYHSVALICLFVCLFHIYLWDWIKSVNNTCAHSAFKANNAYCLHADFIQRILFGTCHFSSANAFCTQFESALFLQSKSEYRDKSLYKKIISIVSQKDFYITKLLNAIVSWKHLHKYEHWTIFNAIVDQLKEMGWVCVFF